MCDEQLANEMNETQINSKFFFIKIINVNKNKMSRNV